MGAVLIDNVSISLLSRAASRLGDMYKYDVNVQNYLYAIILWDDIYSLCDFSRTSVHKRYSQRVCISNKTLHIQDLSYDTSEIGCKSMDIADNYLEEFRSQGFYTDAINSAIFYLLLGHSLGMNTLLSEDRAKFIVESGISKKMFSRIDVLAKLEKEISDFYDEVNRWAEKDLFSIRVPLLVDYICSNAGTFEEALSIAVELREDKDVMAFRRTMDLMDDALNNGDKIAFGQYIRAISEIVNEITNAGINTKTVNLDISLTPSISVPLNIRLPQIKKKMINMNFLSQLAVYGLRGRRR